MNFDLRLPIGIMFSLFGVIIAGYGLMTNGSEIYTTHSLGININLAWGVVMLVFGGAMLFFALRARKPS